jgi:hypothetical protein
MSRSKPEHQAPGARLCKPQNTLNAQEGKEF